MGKYINENSKGKALPATGKVGALIDDGAVICEPKVGAVCVCINGPFDAAAWCYNQREVDDFTDQSDRRPKVWLWYPHAETLAK